MINQTLIFSLLCGMCGMIHAISTHVSKELGIIKKGLTIPPTQMQTNLWMSQIEQIVRESIIDHSVALQLHSICFQSSMNFAFCFSLLSQNEVLSNSLVHASVHTSWIPDISQKFNQLSLNKDYPSSGVMQLKTDSLLAPLFHLLLQISTSLKSFSNEITTDDIERLEQMFLITTATEFFRRYGDVVDFMNRLYHLYFEWYTAIEEWEEYIGSLRLQRSVASTLTSRTSHIIEEITTSPFFELHSEKGQGTTTITSLIPYSEKLPEILETASPAKLMMVFCNEYDCKISLQQRLDKLNYMNFPHLMRQLTYILTQERRSSHMNSYSQMRDEHLYSTQLAQTCMDSDHTMEFCQIAAIYQPTICFYLSQALIIENFHGEFPVLWDFCEPEEFAVVEFNQYLKNLYKDLRVFFKLPADLYLDFWEATHWSNDVVDAYMLFIGNNDVWEARPPVSILTDRFTKQNIDLKSFSLQFFWRRVLDIFKSHRVIWWTQLLTIASQFDYWTSLYKEDTQLLQSLPKRNLISAINHLIDCAFEIQKISHGTILIPMQLQTKLAIRTISLRGSIVALLEVVDILENSVKSKTKKLAFWKQDNILMKKSERFIIHEMPNIPTTAAILRSNQDSISSMSVSLTNFPFANEHTLTNNEHTLTNILTDLDQPYSPVRSSESFLSSSSEILPLIAHVNNMPESSGKSAKRSLRSKVSQKFLRQKTT